MNKAFPYAAVLVIIAWLVTLLALPLYFKGPSTVNEFGDMFGAVNALYSGLALAALLATLWAQKEELSKQSEMQSEQTKILQYTARFHALSALLASYTQQIANAPGTLSGQEIIKVDRIRMELETHLEK